MPAKKIAPPLRLRMRPKALICRDAELRSRLGRGLCAQPGCKRNRASHVRVLVRKNSGLERRPEFSRDRYREQQGALTGDPTPGFGEVAYFVDLRTRYRDATPERATLRDVSYCTCRFNACNALQS